MVNEVMVKAAGFSGGGGGSVVVVVGTVVVGAVVVVVVSSVEEVHAAAATANTIMNRMKLLERPITPARYHSRWCRNPHPTRYETALARK